MDNGIEYNKPDSTSLPLKKETKADVKQVAAASSEVKEPEEKPKARKAPEADKEVQAAPVKDKAADWIIPLFEAYVNLLTHKISQVKIKALILMS